MNVRRAVIVHNPTAGNSDIDPNSLRQAVQASGYRADYITVGDQWRDQVADADIAIAVGGDGTVREILVELAGTDVPVAIVPAGTANNIARALRLPVEHPLVALTDLATGRYVRFDVPTLSLNGSRERFVEAVGAGVFADLLVERAANDEGTDGGLRRLHRLLDRSETMRWTIVADGVDLSGDYIGVEAMNINETGPNIMLAPDADTGDAMIDLVLLDDADRRALQRVITNRSNGDTRSAVRFRTFRCRSLRIALPRAARLRRDDDLVQADETTTIEIVDDGTAVTVITPSR